MLCHYSLLLEIPLSLWRKTAPFLRSAAAATLLSFLTRTTMMMMHVILTTTKGSKLVKINYSGGALSTRIFNIYKMIPTSKSMTVHIYQKIFQICFKLSALQKKTIQVSFKGGLCVRTPNRCLCLTLAVSYSGPKISQMKHWYAEVAKTHHQGTTSLLITPINKMEMGIKTSSTKTLWHAWYATIWSQTLRIVLSATWRCVAHVGRVSKTIVLSVGIEASNAATNWWDSFWIR